MTRAVVDVAERPIGLVRGTCDWLPGEAARINALERLLLDRFARAGYEPLRTPVLEFTELHERKSGAGIVAKLFELSGGGQGGVCLRPELTAGIVRAYTSAEGSLPLPWRVSHAGPVFRFETPRPDRLREFQQVGVERIGDGGPQADAEMIWLADWALAEAGVKDATIRIGHVGMTLEMLRRSGLPEPTRAALVEMLSEAATEGHNIQALEHGLEQLAGWLQAAESEPIPGAVESSDDAGIDRLFRTLVPVITGRRSGREIVRRLRRKWDLGHGLLAVLDRVRAQVHHLADLKGNPADILERLSADYQSLAPDSVAALSALVRTLADYGVDSRRVELDLGFGRGIGFYSQMVFEVVAATADGPVEVCGGGRYDGLARVLGSPRDDRGVGFAFGLERLWQVLRAQGGVAATPGPSGSLIVPASPESGPHAIALARQLWERGARAVLGTERTLADAVEAARPLNLARVVIVAGPLDDPGALRTREHAGAGDAASTVAELLRIASQEAEGRR